jgi:quinoprotein glucose dehydrogenase
MALFAVLVAAGVSVRGQDWLTVGNDAGGMKFSPLTEITPDNVTQLKVAWTYDTGDPATGRGYSVTPIVINDLMYLPVRGSVIVALRSGTGEEEWTSDLNDIDGIGMPPRFSAIRTR